MGRFIGISGGYGERKSRTMIAACKGKPGRHMTQIVTVTSEGPEVLRTDIDIRAHHVVADETKDANGESLGPEPHELLLAGLGACTAMTVRLYAARKGFPLERITVRLSRRKIKASECADCR